ncbi:hypothetical protein ACFY1L_54165 [Streptomyces sp. NPDC001663]|uniref:hypothetical protein n=1 Tax=Streptomyces sp. NPDC001663 TaxID=3364597 RepID=UPI0036C1FA1F
MKTVVQVKLTPDAAQASALKRTLHTLNTEANRVSALGEKDRTRKGLQTLAYAGLKARGLSAQPGVSVALRKSLGFTWC